MANQLRYQGVSPEGNGMNRTGNLEEIERLAKRNFDRYGMTARVFRSDGIEIIDFLAGLEIEKLLVPNISAEKETTL